MSYYRIKAILHSGKLGERNTHRTDGRNPLRINRIVDINDHPFNGDIKLGERLLMKYIKDENGNDYAGVLATSWVVDWDYSSENEIWVETRNSIYELEKGKGEEI